VVIGNGLI